MMREKQKKKPQQREQCLAEEFYERLNLKLSLKMNGEANWRMNGQANWKMNEKVSGRVNERANGKLKEEGCNFDGKCRETPIFDS